MKARLSFDAETFLARLWAMDAVLEAAGFHRMSDWWRAEISRFIRALARGQHGRCRRWIIRAGRRAGKSSSLCRLAVAWAKWGTWSVPGGDTAVVAFVSVSKDEAGARLRTIDSILSALGEVHLVRGDELELSGARRVFFKVFAATVKATVGFTAILVIGDEVSRWEAKDTAANPAKEVFGGLFPTLATQLFGFAVLCSSPWGTDDYHHECFDQGDTRHQITSFAETWVANPTITEEQTHELEPDERTWQREYAAIPGATLSIALDSIDVAACFGREFPGATGAGFISTDASSLTGNDRFAWMGGTVAATGEVVVREIGAWAGQEQRDVLLDDIAAKLSTKSAEYGAAAVLGDQREAAGLTSHFLQRDTAFISYDWSIGSKDAAVQLLRRLMRERKLYIPEHAETKRELLQLRARLLPSGLTKYETNGKDFASCMITLAHAILNDDVRQVDPDAYYVGTAPRNMVRAARTIGGSGGRSLGGSGRGGSF